VLPPGPTSFADQGKAERTASTKSRSLTPLCRTTPFCAIDRPIWDRRLPDCLPSLGQPLSAYRHCPDRRSADLVLAKAAPQLAPSPPPRPNVPASRFRRAQLPTTPREPLLDGFATPADSVASVDAVALADEVALADVVASADAVAGVVLLGRPFRSSYSRCYGYEEPSRLSAARRRSISRASFSSPMSRAACARRTRLDRTWSR
jgi:hypothetical protein